MININNLIISNINKNIRQILIIELFFIIINANYNYNLKIKYI